jgi:hypothetical protein
MVGRNSLFLSFDWLKRKRQNKNLQQFADSEQILPKLPAMKGVFW